MDALAVSGFQLSPVKGFDQKVEIRAEKHEHLRGRNNVTSCRSPTREFNTKLIKNELKEKRHLEFLRRRSVSPDLCGEKSTNCSSKRKTPKTFAGKKYTSVSKSETLYTNIQNTQTVNGHPVMILTPNSSVSDDPSTSKWVKTKSFYIIWITTLQNLYYIVLHLLLSLLISSGFLMVRTCNAGEAWEIPHKEASIYLHNSDKRIKQEEKHR